VFNEAGSVRAKDRTLSRNWIKQVIGGDGNSKLEQQQLQQQPKPSTAAAVASAVSLASFTNGILMGLLLIHCRIEYSDRIICYMDIRI